MIDADYLVNMIMNMVGFLLETAFQFIKISGMMPFVVGGFSIFAIYRFVMSPVTGGSDSSKRNRSSKPKEGKRNG